jgi:pilus assembly protein CpaB
VSHRRRALALAALSLLLGALAISNVAGREAALNRRVGPTVPVIVARLDLPVGAALGPRALAVRRVPRRFVPTAAFARPAQLQGLTAAVAIPAGTDLTGPLLRDPAAAGAAAATDAAGGALAGGGTLRPGERVAEIVARGDAGLLSPGSRIDLLVTRETADGSGDTTLALEDVEVLAAAPTPAQEGDGSGRQHTAGPQVALSLRVSLREAVALAAAQNFAKELRILVRVDGDRRHGAEGMTVTDSSK